MARRVLVVPVFKGSMPYGLMNRYQALNPRSDEPAVVAFELVRVLMASPLTADAMADAVLLNLEHSSSFNETRGFDESAANARTLIGELRGQQRVQRTSSNTEHTREPHSRCALRRRVAFLVSNRNPQSQDCDE